MSHLTTMRRDLKSNLPITSLQANPKNTHLILSVGNNIIYRITLIASSLICLLQTE